MSKLKITKNKVIVILSIILITSCVFIKINDIYNKHKEENKEQKMINELINDSSNSTNNTTTNNIKETTTKDKKYNYVAVLEIPKIDLRKGLVMATSNFNSINYAVSIDKNSKFPNEIGNFILYAHSGNSRISYFDRIKELNKSDEVKVFYNGIWYKYNVVKKYEIDKTGKMSIYNDYKNSYITLVTCSQKDKTKQVVVLGKMVD